MHPYNYRTDNWKGFFLQKADEAVKSLDASFFIEDLGTERDSAGGDAAFGTAEKNRHLRRKHPAFDQQGRPVVQLRQPAAGQQLQVGLEAGRGLGYGPFQVSPQGIFLPDDPSPRDLLLQRCISGRLQDDRGHGKCRPIAQQGQQFLFQPFPGLLPGRCPSLPGRKPPGQEKDTRRKGGQSPRQEGEKRPFLRGQEEKEKEQSSGVQGKGKTGYRDAGHPGTFSAKLPKYNQESNDTPAFDNLKNKYVNL